MAFSAADVKKLREQTGAGMMACKKALQENEGDYEKAVDFLRAKGLAAAAKKQSRVAAEGMVQSCVRGKLAALVEVNSETDFVAKNDDFQSFVTTVANVAVDSGISDVAGLLEAKTPAGSSVKDIVSELTVKIGEKIDVRRVQIVKLETQGLIGSYVHGGKIGVLVKVEADKDVSSNEDVLQLAKDLSMHVAAAAPQFVSADEIDEDFKAREAEVYTAQLKEQGKPENMIPNIVKGKLNKLATEVCLYEQSFVKDPDQKISALIDSVAKKAGATLKVTEFLKFNLGEGIEKREDNFADEVAKMTGGN